VNRTALRLATRAALTAGGAGPFPTMAGNRIFDSRAEPIGDIGEDEAMPTVVIYTDRDHHNRAGPNGMPMQRTARRTLDFRVEISLTTKNIDPLTEEQITGWPETDADLEAALDLFEWQIEVALFGNSPWARWWNDLFGVAEITSERIALKNETGNVRLAAREIAYSLWMKPECLPEAVRQGDPVPAAALLGLYPEVADYIIAKGADPLKAQVQQQKQLLEAQAIPGPHVYPPLNTVQFRIAASPPLTEEVKAIWDMNPDN
jgi:hypothetical protein